MNRMLASQQSNLWRLGPGVIAALIVFGVVTGLGITRAVGCVSAPPWGVTPGSFLPTPPWSTAPLNTVVSAVLWALACIAMVSSRRIALGLLAIEFVGFVAFLFLLRGGYAVGFTGQPQSQVVMYDALCIEIRVGILGLLAFGKRPDGRLLMKVALTGLGMALLIVVTKAALFRLPVW